MRFWHSLIGSLAVIGLFTAPLLAAEWRLLAEKSSIAFTYFENDTAMEGRFPSFTGEAFYDPAWAQEAIVQVRVRTEDVKMQDFLRTAFAKTEDWFHTQAYPEAVMNISALEPLEDGRIRAIGELTLKGKTFALTPVFTLEQEGACLRATGSFPMRLSDYDIGTGTVSRMISVRDEITLHFDLRGHLAFAENTC